MATDIVKDYLGHPCQTTEAFEIFSDQVEAADKTAERDQRAVTRDIGRALLDLRSRIDHLGNLLTACKGLAPNDTDSDPLVAVLEAGEQYGIDCSNRYGDLAGLVLKSLELGHLFERRSSEAAHG